VKSECVKVVAFEGGGDDMDRPIKNLLSRNNSNGKSRKVTGVNSYNIGRPLMQMVYYVSPTVFEDYGGSGNYTMKE
jgi:threonine synthase